MNIHRVQRLPALAKWSLALLLFGMRVGGAAEALPEGRPAILSGRVTDITGAVIPGAIALIRNQQNDSSQKVVTDQRGEFKITGLDPGVYTVKVRSPGFETFVRSNVHLGSELELALKIQMNLCQSQLGAHVPNFSTLLDLKAESDTEKRLLAQAEALPCSDDGAGNGWLERQLNPTHARAHPTCANVEGMRYYFDLVKQNRRGHLPEAGEGPVEAKAYYGGVLKFDNTARQWTVTLTLEYVICCGTVCGGMVRHTRRVTFGSEKNFLRLEDDPDGVCGWVS
jgi:hypothetical protein